MKAKYKLLWLSVCAVSVLLWVRIAAAQMIDNTQPTNPINAGINKSLTSEIDERNWDGTTQSQFLTRPLWEVGSLGSLGHDGRSINLTEVILRHGGEAQAARDAFANILSSDDQGDALVLLHFLGTLILFPPDDTTSTLDPGNPGAPDFPQNGHGSIKLTVLFDNPSDKE